MKDEDLTIAKIIVLDIKKADITSSKEDIKRALESAKRIFNDKNEINISIVKYLKGHGITLVWNTINTETSSERRLGLKYNNKGYELPTIEKEGCSDD